MTTTMTETDTTTEITAGMKTGWNGINRPGCWIHDATGNLIRVSNDFDWATWNSWWTCEGGDTWWWTFINEDPDWPTDACREAAATWGISCNF